MKEKIHNTIHRNSESVVLDFSLTLACVLCIQGNVHVDLFADTKETGLTNYKYIDRCNQLRIIH